MATVGELVAASMPQHVRVHGERKLRGLGRCAGPSAGTKRSVRASFGTRPAAFYQPGFCVGHRVLHLTRGVNLDSSTPQSAPCGRSDGQCLITILGPFSCPNWFAAK